jgi:hypothetical protein
VSPVAGGRRGPEAPIGLVRWERGQALRLWVLPVSGGMMPSRRRESFRNRTSPKGLARASRSIRLPVRLDSARRGASWPSCRHAEGPASGAVREGTERAAPRSERAPELRTGFVLGLSSRSVGDTTGGQRVSSRSRARARGTPLGRQLRHHPSGVRGSLLPYMGPRFVGEGAPGGAGCRSGSVASPGRSGRLA